MFFCTKVPIFQSAKLHRRIQQLITFSTNMPRCQMTFATLTLKLSTTFSSISFGILLIPDLWMNRRMNRLDFLCCCKRWPYRWPICSFYEHMGKIYQLIIYTFHESSRPSSELRTAIGLVVNVQFHASCRSNFSTKHVIMWPWGIYQDTH